MLMKLLLHITVIALKLTHDFSPKNNINQSINIKDSYYSNC